MSGMANAPATKKTAHPKEGINPNSRNTQNLTNHINFLIRVLKSGATALVEQRLLAPVGEDARRLARGGRGSR